MERKAAAAVVDQNSGLRSVCFELEGTVKELYAQEFGEVGGGELVTGLGPDAELDLFERALAPDGPKTAGPESGGVKEEIKSIPNLPPE